MAQTPIDKTHALQIQAGRLGRNEGHAFEYRITDSINNIPYPLQFDNPQNDHLITGDPAYILLNFISSVYGKARIERAEAISTGALATSEVGKNWLEINGIRLKRCKSDIILVLKFSTESKEKTIGVSTKQCNNKKPTNAQLYFTTASGFSKLIREHDIHISNQAVDALRMFCGDEGYRPKDVEKNLKTRHIDPRRYFWEEIDNKARIEWENLFTNQQDKITKLLLQKAYLDDQYEPDFVLHKTKHSEFWKKTEIAIYMVDDLIRYSRQYGKGLSYKPYAVTKGSYRDPPGIPRHLAPRFGIIQMQRGGQAQHPSQLQFNLEAGYFYKISKKRHDMLRDRKG